MAELILMFFFVSIPEGLRMFKPFWKKSILLAVLPVGEVKHRRAHLVYILEKTVHKRRILIFIIFRL